MRWTGEDGKDILEPGRQFGRGWLMQEVFLYDITMTSHRAISLPAPTPASSGHPQKDGELLWGT